MPYMSETEFHRYLKDRRPKSSTWRCQKCGADMGQLSTPFDFETHVSYSWREDKKYVHSCGGEVKEEA